MSYHDVRNFLPTMPGLTSKISPVVEMTAMVVIPNEREESFAFVRETLPKISRQPFQTLLYLLQHMCMDAHMLRWQDAIEQPCSRPAGRNDITNWRANSFIQLLYSISLFCIKGARNREYREGTTYCNTAWP